MASRNGSLDLGSNIKSVSKELRGQLNKMERKVLPQAEPIAVNKLMTEIKGKSTKAISAATRIKQKLIRKRFAIQKAPSRVVRLITAAIPISLLKPKGKLPKVASRATYAGRKFPHIFTATLKSGHEDIFERKGKKRLPIRKKRINIRAQAEAILNATSRELVRTRFPKLLNDAIRAKIRRLIRQRSRR